jgi:class 3 adenylate cyclase
MDRNEWGGLNRYNKEQDNFTHFTTENGLVNDQIYSLVCDNNGMLWMGTNSGLCRFNPMDYSCKNFSEKDGIQNYEYNTGAAIKLKDGTLLIGGIAGYNIINPDKIENKKLALPVVVISSFKIFDRETPTGDGHLKLSFKENSISFEFAGLSYYRNQENHYAYKLEGVDRDWIKSGTRRYVSYSKLQPGDYTFKVKASNTDGMWNETGAQLQITITPPWWKTSWAKFSFVLFVVGSSIGYYRYRTHAFRVRQRELVKEVEKATVTIRKQKEIVEEEKKRSDELLLNILPEETAEELKSTGEAKAKHFAQVTVMFTDFKDFTQASEKLSADELVKEIHYCYSEFDKIISKYRLEKIKTIGDSYMCAGGLPVPNITNAEDCVRAALEMRDFMLKRKSEIRNPRSEIFELRIGCHTGPVVAGIVGIKKFAYDIWGDTVNIASRMESSGQAGKLNISGSTYELVKAKFNCTHRGKISAKNKGEIDMYFVEKAAD